MIKLLFVAILGVPTLCMAQTWLNQTPNAPRVDAEKLQEGNFEEAPQPEMAAQPSMAELPFNLFVPEVSRAPFRLSVRVLNKRNNEIVDYDVSPGITIEHDGLFISAKRCVEKTNDRPETAWVEVVNAEGGKIFVGWMYAAFPEFNPFQHAVYEVRLNKCLPVKK